MRAVVTTGPGEMEMADVPEPEEPGPGEVIVRPQAVGICGSDFHFFLGELGPDDGSQFPRIQGHEVAGVVESVGPECEKDLDAGERVALHPLSHCGRCYPCRIGRYNVCDNFSLIGIHEDGGFQELLRMPEELVFPTDEERPAVAALAEPLSIAVRAINRSRLERGEHVVILGAGPIGQAISLLASERGAPVLMIDPVQSRLELAASMGAETLLWTYSDDVVAHAREWSGGEGSEVVFDATGAPDAIRAGFETAVSAGRLVMVGMSSHDVPMRVFGFVDKELDVLGVSCAQPGEFEEAIAFVERHSDRVERLITQEFPLEQAPDALQWAMDHPAEAMKVVIEIN
jgi:threonine dehydrogenase-like Zn-dependent dehydrogenase